MYDVILIPKTTEVNEDGNTVNPLVIYITNRGKFYATVHLNVVIGEEQYIPSPNDDEVNTVNNVSGGEDIHIDLEVLGHEGGVQIFPITLKKEIMEGEASPGEALDKQAVRDLIADREYNLNVTAYFEGKAEGNGSGNVSNNSDIEIF